MERYNRFIVFDAEWIVFGNLPEVFCKKDVFKIFAKFTGNHLCRSLRPATSIRKRPRLGIFPVNFAKFLRFSFSRNIYSGCFWIVFGCLYGVLVL